MSLAPITADDRAGRLLACTAEGRFTDGPLDTSGCRAVVRVPGLRRLLRYMGRNGFGHPVAMSASRCAGLLAEAFENYVGWETCMRNADAR